MNDVKLGKQRLEIDWDTGGSTDLDPYIKRLLEKNAALEDKLKRRREGEVWYEYELVDEMFPRAALVGSGEMPARLLDNPGMRTIKWQCKVVRTNVS